MAAGPGKYDDLATLVRERAQAEAVVVLVAGGNKGNGMSVQMVDPGYLNTLPGALREMADKIEAQAKSMQGMEDYPENPPVTES